MKVERIDQGWCRRALWAVALLGSWAFITPAQTQSRQSGLVGTHAPIFLLQGIYNETYTLDQFKGHILVMQFGSSW